MWTIINYYYKHFYLIYFTGGVYIDSILPNFFSGEIYINPILPDFFFLAELTVKKGTWGGVYMRPIAYRLPVNNFKF